MLTQICSALENYFPSWILTGHADLSRGSKLDPLRETVLIFANWIHPWKPNCISQYLLESGHTAAACECGEPWTCLFNGFEKILCCKDWYYHKDGPILNTCIFWSRTSKKLQKAVSLRGSTESTNKCLNSHLMTTKLMETNNNLSTVVFNSSWSSEST